MGERVTRTDETIPGGYITNAIYDTGEYNDKMTHLIDKKLFFGSNTPRMKTIIEQFRVIESVKDYRRYGALVKEILANYEDVDKIPFIAYGEKFVDDLVKQKTSEDVCRTIDTWHEMSKSWGRANTPREKQEQIKISGMTVAERLETALAKVKTSADELEEKEISYYTMLEQDEEATDEEATRNYLDRVKEWLKKGEIYTRSEILKEIARYTLATSTFTTYNYLAESELSVLGQRVWRYTYPIVLGFLPIAHCQEIEVTRSGQIVKFRATGSIFLANQKGSDDAIRVSFLILADEQGILIPALWTMFLYCKGDIKTLDTLKLQSLSRLRTMANTMMVNKDFQEPSIEFYRTFPLITRNIIIPNVYIETFSFEDLVQDGKDVVKCSLMLRTYRKPSIFHHYTIGDTNKIFVGAEPDQNTNMYNMLEVAASNAWRVVNYVKAIIVENPWKANSPAFVSDDRYNPDLDDVYYNINAEDVAAAVVLGVYGIRSLGI